jgi:hypothetical protein
MKKILIAFPLAALIFALAACDDGSVKTTKSLTKTSATTSGLPPNSALNKVLLLGDLQFGGLTFVSTYLAPFGFAQIDSMDNSTTTPTVAQLQAYDVILVWTNTAIPDRITLGSNLAAFVDGGGGLVLCSYSNYTDQLQGSITTGYSPYNMNGSNPNVPQTLGPVYQPSHYIMQGVTTLGATLRDNPTLSANGSKLADYANGDPLAAVHNIKKVVGIAFVPNNNDGSLTGDYARLIANALAWVGKR